MRFMKNGQDANWHHKKRSRFLEGLASRPGIWRECIVNSCFTSDSGGEFKRRRGKWGGHREMMLFGIKIPKSIKIPMDGEWFVAVFVRRKKYLLFPFRECQSVLMQWTFWKDAFKP
jgi:hypothetical protein